MNIAVYISGHGFGHLAQMAPVLNRIHALKPECRFLIRSALPYDEIDSRLDFDFELESTDTDVGVVQKSAIEEDREASIVRMRRWVDALERQIARETSLLRSFAPSVVVSNISPLAFPAAQSLEIPNIGLATLDWHTIYAHWLAPDDPVIEKLAQAYAACDLLLTPPMAMDMGLFPVRRQIGLIAAQPAAIPDPAGDTERKRALVLFGGCAHPPFDMAALAAMDEWLFLMPGCPAGAPDNVQAVHFGNGLRAVDVMPLVDVVVCKPGYGVLSECWSCSRPIAWVERPDFPEFPMLKRWLDECMPAAGMSRSDFRHGNWLAALQAASSHGRKFPLIDSDGAHQAADIILSCGAG